MGFRIEENEWAAKVLQSYEGTDETTVVVPEGIGIIGNAAFANNYAIECVKLPDSVVIIGSQAFWCSSIKNISLSSSLVEIGDSAFRGSRLEKIELPSKVKHIRRGAFLECTRLKSASLPEGLEDIGHNAFQWCYELKEINIPRSVKSFGKDLFDDCMALKKLTCYENFVIDADIFGNRFPKGLISSLDTLEEHMTSSAYQKYVLVDSVWSRLKIDTQVNFFIKRNTKGTLPGYSNCIKADDADNFGIMLLRETEEKEIKGTDQAIFNFIYLFYDFSDKEIIKKLFLILKNRKNTEKLVIELEQSKAIMGIIDDEKMVSEEKDSNVSLFNGDFSYQDIDSIPENFYSGIDDFDIKNPIKTKLKKTIVSFDKLKYIFKFQSDLLMNEQLKRITKYWYDPCYIIDNNLYEERSEMVKYFNRDEPQENYYIIVKDKTDNLTLESLTKRLKVFSQIVNSLQDEKTLKKILELMPKKKNGTLFVKRSTAIAPVLATNHSFELLVLCAKAVKDTEVEMSIKSYTFNRIEEVQKLLENADKNFMIFMM